jgi:hypothetical protein
MHLKLRLPSFYDIWHARPVEFGLGRWLIGGGFLFYEFYLHHLHEQLPILLAFQ